MPLLLQILDTCFHSTHQGEGLTGHNTGGLKSHLTGNEASVIILTTPYPRLEERWHLDLVVSVGKSPLMGTDGVGKAKVPPFWYTTRLGGGNDAGINLREGRVGASIKG